MKQSKVFWLALVVFAASVTVFLIAVKADQARVAYATFATTIISGGVMARWWKL
jgi:multidrug transporter EmrE-like cation transporter